MIHGIYEEYVKIGSYVFNGWELPAIVGFPSLYPAIIFN